MGEFLCRGKPFRRHDEQKQGERRFYGVLSLLLLSYQHQLLQCLPENNDFIMLLIVGLRGGLLANLLTIFCQDITDSAKDQRLRVYTGQNQIVLGRARLFVQGIFSLVDMSYNFGSRSHLVQIFKTVDPGLAGGGGTKLVWLAIHWRCFQRCCPNPHPPFGKTLKNGCLTPPGPLSW